MRNMRHQGDDHHRVRKTAGRAERGVVEADQRLVIAVMAIGMIVGALLAPASSSEPAKPATAAKTASVTR